jgi:hypothetical protein
VGDKETAIGGALHHSEHAGAGRCPAQPDIEDHSEWSPLLVFIVVILRGNARNRFREDLVQIELLQQASSNEETDSISGSIIRQAEGDPIALKLSRVRLSDSHIVVDLGSNHLGNDFLVRNTRNKAVFPRTILRTILLDER